MLMQVIRQVVTTGATVLLMVFCVPVVAEATIAVLREQKCHQLPGLEPAETRLMGVIMLYPITTAVVKLNVEPAFVSVMKAIDLFIEQINQMMLIGVWVQKVLSTIVLQLWWLGWDLNKNEKYTGFVDHNNTDAVNSADLC